MRQLRGSLARRGIPSPSAHRYGLGLVKQQYLSAVLWRANTARAILQNEVYLGHTVQGRKRASLYLSQKQKKLPQEQWLTMENTHPAIVGQELFDAVQALLGKGQHHGKNNRPLAGKNKCDICGHAMPLRGGKEPYFTCGTKWYDSDYSCGDFHVGQAELYEVLTAALQQ